MLAFAANSLLCRAALAGGHADATSFTTIRLAGGAVALGLVVRARGSRTRRGALAWGSAVALFAYVIGFSLAYVRLPTGVGALFLFIAVQLTMVGAGVRAGERPRPVEWSGLALSIVGLVVLTRPGLARPDPVRAFLMLGAGVASGCTPYERSKTKTPRRRTPRASRARCLLPSPRNGLAALLGVTRLGRVGVLLALASGALASGLGYALWCAALRGLTATRAAVVQLSVPLLAAAGGVLLLGEEFSSRLVVASVLILGGIALTVLGRRREPISQVR